MKRIAHTRTLCFVLIGYVSVNGRYFNLTYPLTEKIRDTRRVFGYKANPALENIFVHSDNGEFNSEKMLAFLLKHVDIGDCDTSVNDCGTRGAVSTIVYLMRSLMKPTEKREPTITYSGMIPGEEPPYRPLLTEQIDIEQSLQELGQVSAGLVEVEDALEE